jgi:hypothetical protein
MSNLVMSGTFAKQQLEKDIKALAFSFLAKLAEDDTSPGLHVEPINNPIDPRVRTGRVNQQYRAVLYKLGHESGEPTYLFAGVWNHDDAIQYAKTHKLQVNPVNGVAELIEESQPVTQLNAEASVTVAGSATAAGIPVLKARSYFPADLVDGFGLTQGFADYVFTLATEDDVRAYAATLPTSWHGDVLDGMLAGMSVDEIKNVLGLVAETPEEQEEAGFAEPEDPAVVSRPVEAEDNDARLLAALKHPAAQAQWKFIDGDDELRDIIDSGDLAGWRVFLHPEQRRYVDRDYKGPFRLTGGAGTGKTVVLLHRARRLALANSRARVVLTTFTRQLAANLQRDLERLDPKVPIAPELGEPGVLIRGIDQLAVAIRKAGTVDYGKAGLFVVGEDVGIAGAPIGNHEGWDDALAIAGGGLPAALHSPQFLEAEYLQVVLPNRITGLDDYRKVRRPGRGVMLNRAKRDALWQVIERYRTNARLAGKVSFADAAEISAAFLDASGATFADHVLVDEGQDLNPSHWKLLRAMVAPSTNDLFLAEDSHQRIYGQRVVLSRYGISLRGRSRRLSLNYRTTAQNLRFALSILEGGEYVDPEGDDEGIVGPYRSARSGPAPQVIAASNSSEQLVKVAKVVTDWIAADVPPASIAVLTATQAPRLQEKLAAAGVPCAEPKGDDLPTNKVAVLTMYKAKGLEFSRVIINDVSAGSYPPPASLRNVLPDDLPETLAKARSLLYVAASRARDELVVSYAGKPSELLRAE